MKTLLRFSVLLACLLLVPCAVLAEPAPPVVPAALEVPAGQTLALTLTGRGVQIYEWRALPGGAAKFGWVLKAPEADLFDAQGQRVGRHFDGPTWELTGGGKVVGTVKARADAPDGRGIPWLLLEAAQTTGEGVMGKVQSIRRINTVGGRAPAEPADTARTGQEVRVEYTATYQFYINKP